MNYLLKALFLFGSLAHAEIALNDLRESFREQMANSNALFDRAAKLQPTRVAQETEMSKEQCLRMKALITRNYKKMDPFEFEGRWNLSESYKNRTYDDICGELHPGRLWLQDVTGRSNLDLPYSQILIKETYNNGQTQSIKMYLLDQDARIVEIQEQDIHLRDQNVSPYEIASMDGDGNIYKLDRSSGYLETGHGDFYGGEHFVERYIAADGSTAGSIVRDQVFSSENGGLIYQALSYSRADQKDWEDYILPITFAFNGVSGFVQYRGKFSPIAGELTYRSDLTIKSRRGKEFCAGGFIYAHGKKTFLPDDRSYAKCEND